MHTHPTRPTTANFKAQALTVDDLRAQAPSVFSPGPMAGLSTRYAFVPTSEILQALGERCWVPVDVEQQRVRIAARFGFQKHLIRFLPSEQMRSLDEWNAELVLTNSHDALCAYVLRVGICRRIVSLRQVCAQPSLFLISEVGGEFHAGPDVGSGVVRSALDADGGSGVSWCRRGATSRRSRGAIAPGFERPGWDGGPARPGTGTD